MSDKITRRDIRERQQANLTNHYLSLEVMVISVALAIAGLAAASLIAGPGNPSSDLALLWLLWIGGLLATAVAYAGPMIGAFALPPSIPTIVDLLPPLGLGVVEFLMFAVLIRQVAPVVRFSSVFGTWLWLVAIFGVIALIAIGRARFLFGEALDQNVYGPDIRDVIDDYRKDLSNNVWGPVPLISVAAVGAILWLAGFHQKWLAFLLSVLVIMLLLGALWFQGRTARIGCVFLRGSIFPGVPVMRRG